MGGRQNYGPFLGTLNIRCRIIIGIQKGTIILTTTQMDWCLLHRPRFRPLQPLTSLLPPDVAPGCHRVDGICSERKAWFAQFLSFYCGVKANEMGPCFSKNTLLEYLQPQGEDTTTLACPFVLRNAFSTLNDKVGKMLQHRNTTEATHSKTPGTCGDHKQVRRPSYYDYYHSYCYHVYYYSSLVHRGSI